MTDSSESAKFYGWSNLRILFAIYFLGMGMVFYGFNVIFPEMITDMGWSRGDASWAQSLRGILIGFSIPVVALFLNRYGTRKSLILGLAILTGGLFLLGTVTTQLWQWIALWGLIMPLGFAFGGVLPIQTNISYWFNAKRSMALGIVMTAAGVGGFIAQPLYAWLIEAFGSWRFGWLAAGVCALIATFCAFMVKGKPEDYGQIPDGTHEQIKQNGSDKNSAKVYQSSVSWDLRDAIRTPAVWFILIIMVAQIMPLYMLSVHGVFHLRDAGFERMHAASIISFLIAGSAIARFPMGWLGDKVEPRYIIAVLHALLLITFLVLWKTPNLTSMLIAAPIFGFAFGGGAVLAPALVANYFGRESFASINGFIFPIQIIFASSVPVGAGYLVDATGSYDWAFIILSLFIVASTICSVLASPPAPDSHATEG
ncbi:MAG: MFS transporter [Pseudomonadales bacterium]|nr:MFS transporter [Pseudomonadales bacterium]